MSLNKVTVVCDLYDGAQNARTQGTGYWAPTTTVTDATDHVLIDPGLAVPVAFHAGTSPPSVSLIACDNAQTQPAGVWAWTFTPPSGSGLAAQSYFVNFASGATQYLSALTPVSTPSALLSSIAAGVSVSPSGDTTGAADQAAITAAESAGRTVYFAPGTFWVTGLTKQANTIWQGSGRLATIIKLANGSNQDVIAGANFSTLTLSGSSSGGIGGWGIRDLSIDGNKANQSGTSYGLRVYGYNFDLTNVSIRNCLTDGLYTEWGNFGQPGSDLSMEARYYGLKIEGNGGNGWHNRGPHDSRVYDVTIFSNGSGAYNYWTESCGVPATVAAGSNGVNVSTFAGAGILNVNTTLGFPAASISSTQGSLTVATSGVNAVITYTGVTATSFTGCTTVSGSGTMSTGGSVAATGGGYSANGCLLYGVHGYGGSMAYQYVLDAQNHLVDCVGEVAATGTLLLRSNNCVIEGGQYFVVPGASQTGCGLQFGDTTNGIFGEYIRTYVSGFACTSAATAGVNFVNDQGQNDIDIGVYAASGTVFYGGSPNGASASYKIRAYGQSTAINETGSLWRERSVLLSNVPASLNSAYNVTQNGTDLLNINTSSSRVEFPNGYVSRWYQGAYSTPVLDVDATKAHVVARSGTAANLNPVPSNGSNCTGAAIGAHSSDTAGSVSATMTASPAGGSLVTVTFKNAFTNHAAVIVSPTNTYAAQITTYVDIFGSAFTLQAVAPVPAAVDSQAVSWNYVVIGQDA